MKPVRSILLSAFCGLVLCSTVMGAGGTLHGPLVVSGNWPECTDLVTWARDVIRIDGTERMSETRQGISVYTWLRLFNRMAEGGPQHIWEGPAGEESYVFDPHKHLFVYGWGYCDTHSRIFEALWRELKQDSTAAYRVCTLMNDGEGYHTLARIRLDGSYGGFDLRAGYYLVDRDSPDARVLDWGEVGQKSLIRNEAFRNRCRPFFEFAVKEKAWARDMRPEFFQSQQEWVDAGMKPDQAFNVPRHRMGTPYHDMNWSLPRGSTIERFWSSEQDKWFLPINENPGNKTPNLPSGRFFRVTAEMFDSNYAKNDPNYIRTRNYLTTVPTGEGYPEAMEGGKSLGQSWGRFSWDADMAGGGWRDPLAGQANLEYSASSPHLRPSQDRVPAEAVFEFQCPFVLVDAVFRGELAAAPGDDVRLELRCLEPKPDNRGQPDVWTEWREIAGGGGTFETSIGRESYAPGQVSVHGKYRFQLRLRAYAADRAAAGLNSLGFTASFENGIMTIPQLTAGSNTLLFKVTDQNSVAGPVRVSWEYETDSGTANHSRVIHPRDFSDNRAVWTVHTPGLLRCNSLKIEY